MIPNDFHMFWIHAMIILLIYSTIVLCCLALYPPFLLVEFPSMSRMIPTQYPNNIPIIIIQIIPWPSKYFDKCGNNNPLWLGTFTPVFSLLGRSKYMLNVRTPYNIFYSTTLLSCSPGDNIIHDPQYDCRLQITAVIYNQEKDIVLTIFHHFPLIIIYSIFLYEWTIFQWSLYIYIFPWYARSKPPIRELFWAPRISWRLVSPWGWMRPMQIVRQPKAAAFCRHWGLPLDAPVSFGGNWIIIIYSIDIIYYRLII